MGNVLVGVVLVLLGVLLVIWSHTVHEYLDRGTASIALVPVIRILRPLWVSRPAAVVMGCSVAALGLALVLT
jgi:hypothetical protein